MLILWFLQKAKHKLKKGIRFSKEEGRGGGEKANKEEEDEEKEEEKVVEGEEEGEEEEGEEEEGEEEEEQERQVSTKTKKCSKTAADLVAQFEQGGRRKLVARFGRTEWKNVHRTQEDTGSLWCDGAFRK